MTAVGVEPETGSRPGAGVEGAEGYGGLGVATRQMAWLALVRYGAGSASSAIKSNTCNPKTKVQGLCHVGLYPS